MPTRQNGENIPVDKLESVVKDIICADDSGDEFDDELLFNDVNITNTTGARGLGISISWTNSNIAPIIVPIDSGIKVDVLERNNYPFLWLKTSLDDLVSALLTRQIVMQINT